MNQYPAWKYVMILVVVALGVLYALPNLYGEDPAVQVTSTRGFELSAEVTNRIDDALTAQQIRYKSMERIEDQRLLYRFNSNDDQLRAADAMQAAAGDNYIVALNLAHATPNWLRAIGGKPLTLGLDLQGGVHFLMQLDMETAEGQAINRYVDSIRSTLRDEGIRYVTVREEGNGIRILLRSEDDRAETERIINRDQNLQGLNLRNLPPGETWGIQATIQEQALLEVQQTALKQNITTLRNRINELGVAEPVVQQQGADRVVVQLPGVQDMAEAKKILGSTATLEYRAVDETNDPFSAAQTGRIPADSRLYSYQGQPILLKKRLIVTGDQLIGASGGFDQQTGSPQVSVTLDGVGADRMLDFTRENVGNRMAVVYIEQKPGGQRVEDVISVAVVREPFGKRFQTTGLDSIQEASQLALLLRAGALAAPMEIAFQRTVGPSLGADNIRRGFQSVMIGFALVLVFMAVYYRVFGLIANVALTVNLILLIALLSLLGATLTMPGIAGIVLTVGMAVDANVLIFERIREELDNGNTPQASIRAGYEKAFSTIADANVTTLIAAFVLFLFGTGPVKGFAVTLSLGIVTSMFTAIMGTRALVNLVYGRRKRVEKLAI
jgi:preprotein translocase subunit SecD